jgi:hypothetical protein
VREEIVGAQVAHRLLDALTIGIIDVALEDCRVG